MDDRFQDILDSLPEKPPRSRLEPYRELIDELRRRGRTYREIMQVLAEKCQLQVAANTIHDFVRVRSRAKPNSLKRAAPELTKLPTTAVTAKAIGENSTNQEGPPVDGVQQRIAALKLRSASPQTTPKPFRFDPDEPLHIPPKTGKNKAHK